MRNDPILVGVTGGIGSGKSVICKALQCIGYPVYDADSRAKWLINHDQALKKSIVKAFGEESYRDGKLNRTHLAKSFENHKDLERLNQLVHPAVQRDFEKWIDLQNAVILVKEAALLIETGSYKKLDMTVLVTAPEENRIKRILQRDPFRTEEEIQQIISRQWTDDKKKPLADHIIDNQDNAMILTQILKIVGELEGVRSSE